MLRCGENRANSSWASIVRHAIVLEHLADDLRSVVDSKALPVLDSEHTPVVDQWFIEKFIVPTLVGHIWYPDGTGSDHAQRGSMSFTAPLHLFSLQGGMARSAGRHGIVVVTATNFPEAVDRALLRSGRIERHVRMDLSDAEERAEILRFHLSASVDDKELRKIATDLKGWSGSDLEKLAREARRLARAAGQQAGSTYVAEALPPLQTLPAETARRVAAHEAGHAIVALVLQPTCRVSVSMRKQFRTFSSDAPVQGMTRYLDEPAYLETRPSMEAHICRILGGAAAEEVLIGTRSDGAGGGRGSDLTRRPRSRRGWCAASAWGGIFHSSWWTTIPE